jgi:hypothetical protein
MLCYGSGLSSKGEQTVAAIDNPENGPVAANPAPHVGALFANQFYVSFIGNNIRITFGEVLYGVPEAQWRSAVVLPADMALQLGAVIFDLYQKMQPQSPTPEAVQSTGKSVS